MIADDAIAEAPANITGSGQVSFFELTEDAKTRLGLGSGRYIAVVFGTGPSSVAQVFTPLQARLFATKLLQACR